MQINGVDRGVYSGVAGSEYTIVMIAQDTGRAVCGTLPSKLIVTPQEDGTQVFQGKCWVFPASLMRGQKFF